jgi:hypothetical protein
MTYTKRRLNGSTGYRPWLEAPRRSPGMQAGAAGVPHVERDGRLAQHNVEPGEVPKHTPAVHPPVAPNHLPRE